MRISDWSSDVCSSDLAPRLGRSDRWISLSKVLLPAPEWPVTNSISPAPTSKLTSDSATWPPGYCLLTLSKRRTLIEGRNWGFGIGDLERLKLPRTLRHRDRIHITARPDRKSTRLNS